MKKNFIILIFIFSVGLIFAQAPTFKQIDEKDIKLGNKYFYVFDQAKWEWTLDLLGNKSNFDWRINGTYKITDPKNNFKDKIALKTICKETDATWYFVEHEDFLCMYQQSDKGYEITKFMPLQPKIGMKWMANARQSVVTSVTDDFVKIEVEDEKKATSGYKLFRKNVGLYDLFEIEKNRRGQVTTKWTLINYVPPKIVEPTPTTTTTTSTTVAPTTTTTTSTTVAPTTTTTTSTTVAPTTTTTTSTTVAPTTTTTTSTTVAPTTTTTTSTTVAPTTTTTIKTVTTEFITKLPKNVTLIQVGSFATQEYAEADFVKFSNMGYDCLIFVENNMYKVLVRTTDKNLINTIKTIVPGAFYKQR